MVNDNELESAYEQWDQSVREEFIKKRPERRQQYKNDLGYEIKPLYTPLDLKERGFEYEKDCGFPGQEPFVRGHLPNMNRSDNVLVACYTGYGAAEESKVRYEKVFKWGADKINMAWDLPTQIGYDSDNIMASGEIGRTGVAIDTLRDMEIIFENIPLNKIRGVHVLANSLGPVGLGLLIAIGKKQGLNYKDFTALLQNDPLKEYGARGTYIYPIDASVKLACDAVEWCIQNAPHWKPITFCGNHINAAGAGSVNAAAFAMSNGFVYIDELISRGYSIDQIVPCTTLFLDEREDFFVMAALGRAARKVWMEQMKERYNADPGSPALTFDHHSYSHGGETLQEPINNILRIGFSALAYYLGGTTYMHNAGYDEAMGLTSETTCKVSIRTSQIINNELGFSKTIDPLAGSYYVESLTMDIAKDITAQINRVRDEFGDAKKALQSGYIQGILTSGAVRRQEEFESGERQFVSLNIFKTDEKLPMGALRIDKEIESRQLARLREVKATRDNQKVQETLAHLREVTERNGNTIEPVVEALMAYATVGEICDVWRGIYGEHKPMTKF